VREEESLDLQKVKGKVSRLQIGKRKGIVFLF
jgi:hypothetical protein